MAVALNPVARGAATITVAETLALLDGPFASLAEAVAKGGYAFWLGSGISRDRVDDVGTLVQRILEHLQSQIDRGSDACRFRNALERILGFAQLSDNERDGLDLLLPVAEWPNLPTILQRLGSRYAQVLNVRIDGEPPDYLLWNAVDVCHTYGDCPAGPDCEHICVVILAVEGALTEIASANWDGLIEAAESELLVGPASAIQVCVRSEDLREPIRRARLLKFHGCAVKAKEDEANYRDLLVATQPRIEAWQADGAVSPMREALIQLAVTRPTLMIGLSAQDGNIRNVFNQARARMPWEWPANPPAYVFAEDALGVDQEALLACVYGEAYDRDPTEIRESATFPAYAKPLLTALVFHVLFAKLRSFVRLAPAPRLDYASRDHLVSALTVLRDVIAAHAEGDRLDFIRYLVRQVSHGLGLFRTGRPPSPANRAYSPVGLLPVHQMGGDPNLEAAGQRELAVALALIGLAVRDGTWNVAVENPDSPRAGAFAISTRTRRIRVFFVAGSDAAVPLHLDGRVSGEDDDVVVVQSSNLAREMSRSPSRRRGRKGRSDPRIVGMAALLREAEDAAHLMQRFQEELAL